MSPDPALWTAIGAVFAALVSGFFAWRNSRTATGPANSQANLGWVKQAHEEAAAAKAEARQAKSDAHDAEIKMQEIQRKMAEQERQQFRLDSLTHELMEWVSRVLTRARQVNPNGGHDESVRELLRVIDNGPPSIDGDRLTAQENAG